MKKIVVVKSGQGGRGGFLSEEGGRKIMELARQFGQDIAGGSSLIIASKDPSSFESGKILGDFLGIEARNRHRASISPNDVVAYILEIVELVNLRKNDVDIVFLVVGNKIDWLVPSLVGHHAGLRLRWDEVDKDKEAWIIDCEKRTLVHIP